MRVAEEFAQQANPISAIKAILKDYPLSIALFRELLQNSDDAGASKQVFLIDRRTHPAAALYEEGLRSAQGPAMLAFNDAILNDRDWEGLRSMHDSSKTDDLSKIGKYGVGFRSVFNVTDCPQILSDKSLAIFDPLCAHLSSAGKKIDLGHIWSAFSDTVAPFSPFESSYQSPSSFNGTVIRCPLRARASELSKDVISPNTIRQLMNDFIARELGMSLLFLRNIRTIEFLEIDPNGDRSVLARAVVSKTTPMVSSEAHTRFHQTVIKTVVGSSQETTKEWLIVLSDFPKSEVTDLFLHKPGYNQTVINTNLKDAKLQPEVGIALEVGRLSGPTREHDGQLFTFLPLPITTGLPVHVHALFAIDSSRRHLKREEHGLLPGSRDHTVVQWNKVLFDHFIPRTWRILLEVLVSDYRGNITNIFNIWPPDQPSGELHAYASSLAQNTFNSVLTAQSAVWPVYSPEAQSALAIQYKSLKNVILAPTAILTTYLKALAKAGLMITHPSRHISSCATKANGGVASSQMHILTPELAHEKLREAITTILNLEDTDKTHVLEYLLSTKRVQNIIGLPLIPLGDEKDRIAFTAHTSDFNYTLLTRQEFDVFGPCDDFAVPLHRLPLPVSTLFRDPATLSKLNAQVLSVTTIISYLSQYPNRLDLDLSMVRTDRNASVWLSKFWVWFNTFAEKDELFKEMCGHSEGDGLWVLPSTNGLRQLVMKPTTNGSKPVPLFRLRGQHPVYTQPFLKLGAPFLDSSVDAQAERVLESLELCVTIENAIQLVDALPETPPTETLSPSQCDTILKFFSARLDNSAGEERFRKLKKLPIFPVLSFLTTSNDTDVVDPRMTLTWSAIPDGASIRSVSRHAKIVPDLPGVIFVGLTEIAPDLVRLFEANPSAASTAGRLLFSEHELLEHTANHFSSQPLPTQIAMLSLIHQSGQRIPPYIRTTIEQTAFVETEDGQTRQPGQLLDEEAPVAALYNTEGVGRDQSRFPRVDTPLHRKLVACMKDMKLVQTGLTHENLKERISHISSHAPAAADHPIQHLAKRLLGLICTSTPSRTTKKAYLDFGTTNIDFDVPWLPTHRGLCKPSECRPGSGFRLPLSYSEMLFNLTVGLVEPPDASNGCQAVIPPSLVEIFGWDKPVSTQLLIQQLDQVLQLGVDSDYPRYEAVVEIITELSSRASSLKGTGLTNDEYTQLERVTASKKWIPTQSMSTKSRSLEDPTDTVLDVSPAAVKAGFLPIYVQNENVRLFLQKMGCMDWPSTKTIISKLHSLLDGHVYTAQAAIDLLELLPPNKPVSTIELGKLLVPDEESRLHPHSRVLYNDVGENRRFLSFTSGATADDGGPLYIAHPDVTDRMADDLKLDRLGLKFTELVDVGPSLGQDPITTVRRGLQDYTEQQFLLEFLANAQDAGAKSFRILLNHAKASHLDRHLSVMHSKMEYLCRLPALIIHNDALFSERDFEGICKTSRGGKEDRSDTIGQFGLGALSMYHFTDVATIISGEWVLFLDPSQRHLPIASRSASARLPLRHVLRFYSDHLLQVKDLGFDILPNWFQGTLFILPLRSATSSPQGGLGYIVQEFWSTRRVVIDVLDPFRQSASDCLLFTELEALSCSECVEDGAIRDLWTLSADRDVVQEDPALSITVLKISSGSNVQSLWWIARTTPSTQELPESIQMHCSRRHPSAGLAARMDKSSPEYSSFHFFSGLPLAEATSLPMHIMASFRLSSDRKQIRMDSYASEETAFNLWLLEDIIPSLYLQFMEYLLSSGDRLYRQRWPAVGEGAVSKAVIDGFYKQLRASPSRIFASIHQPTQQLTSQDAVISGDEPANIHQVLEILAPPLLTDIPSAARPFMYQAGVARVDSDFIRDEILRTPATVTSESNPQILANIIHYLVNDTEFKTADHLWGLPILPLEDGSFGTLQSPLEIGEIYYTWKPKQQGIPHQFPLNRIVHPGVSSKVAKELMGLELNVRKLDATAITQFLDEIFQSEKSLSLAVDGFWLAWPEYLKLGLKESGITSYPLVPTLSGTFVSLEACKSGTALLVEGDSLESHQLRGCLQSLGLAVVYPNGDSTPRALQDILKSQLADGQHLSIDNVLAALYHSNAAIDELFSPLDEGQRDSFAQWARQQFAQKPAKQYLDLAQQLPIWPAASRHVRRSLHPAKVLRLLPCQFLLSDASQFLEVLVSDHQNLQNLDYQPMTFAEIHNNLLLEQVLEEGSLAAYKEFFGKWMEYLPREYISVPVPDQAMAIQPSPHLFARDPFFTAIFQPDSSHFVHADFEEFQDQLRVCGLQQENDLDLQMFSKCLTDVQLGAEGGLQIARELFRAYSTLLPRRTNPNDDSIWVELDDYTFIPRRSEQQRRLEDQTNDDHGLPIPARVTSLDEVVPPGDLVREEYEPVAWSRRAVFDVQPTRSLLMVHPKLGRPNFAEVIDHLRYLVSLHPQCVYPSQRRILLHDIEATYQYLDETIGSGELQQNPDYFATLVKQLKTGYLFLNVDKPGAELENWRFDAADCLVFDDQDSKDIGHVEMRYVRKFLLPFENLLEALEVLHVHRPRYAPQSVSTPASDKLIKICTAFNDLRQQNMLTDVMFRFSPGNDNFDDGDAEPIGAHRSFLAVVSDYFKDMFCGSMAEAATMPLGQQITLTITDHSRQCVEIVLDFMYTGQLDGGLLSLDACLDILDLSNYWHVPELHDQIQARITTAYMTPEYLKEIRKAAESYHAPALVKLCDEFADRNRAYIEKVMGVAENGSSDEEREGD